MDLIWEALRVTDQVRAASAAALRAAADRIDPPGPVTIIDVIQRVGQVTETGEGLSFGFIVTDADVTPPAGWHRTGRFGWTWRGQR